MWRASAASPPTLRLQAWRNAGSSRRRDATTRAAARSATARPRCSSGCSGSRACRSCPASTTSATARTRSATDSMRSPRSAPPDETRPGPDPVTARLRLCNEPSERRLRELERVAEAAEHVTGVDEGLLLRETDRRRIAAPNPLLGPLAEHRLDGIPRDVLEHIEKVRFAHESACAVAPAVNVPLHGVPRIER